MPRTPDTKTRAGIRARIRILHSDDIAIGPGKAELLDLIGETGSIAEAAKRMGMSYMRAWTLIRTMNRCFKEPLVRAVRGGREGGGARLTPTGQSALALYQKMESASLAAAGRVWGRMKRLLRR